MTTEATTRVELDLDELERRNAHVPEIRKHIPGAAVDELLRRARQLEKVEAFLREHGERLALFADWAAMRMCATEGDEEVDAIKLKLSELLRSLGLDQETR